MDMYSWYYTVFKVHISAPVVGPRIYIHVDVHNHQYYKQDERPQVQVPPTAS